ncbi:MAG: hypothetical protein ACI857_001104 [Arenicella sp.]|jgi:hypothetical protein
MKTELALFRATRTNTIGLLKGLTLDQLNKIPDNFSGNIAWHIGHMVSTHKGLVYQLNSAPGGLEKDFTVKYKKGSVPESPIDQAEFEFITIELLNQVDELEEDLKKDDFFGENIPYSTSYQFDLNSLEECVKFSNLHQALHLGYIMALKRSL